MNIATAIDRAGYDGPIEQGREVRILCPYHDDTNPSLDINPDNLLFCCRSCYQGGTVIELLAELAGSSLFEAALLLTHSGKGQTKNRHPRNREQERKQAERLYHHLPHVNWELEKVYRYLLDRGLPASILHHAGVKLNRSSSHPYLFPVTEQGVFQGYVARCSDGRKDKYHNNPGFLKKDVLEGDLRPGVVLVVEGMIDKWMSVAHGWRNTTALFGCDLSEEQAEKLAKIATHVISALDPDRAGKEGNDKLHRSMKRLEVPVTDFPFGDWTDDIGAMRERKQFTSRMLACL